MVLVDETHSSKLLTGASQVVWAHLRRHPCSYQDQLLTCSAVYTAGEGDRDVDDDDDDVGFDIATPDRRRGDVIGVR